ncbi:hypothetical protein HDC96_003416 [Stenotrophomonas sp. JAI102]|nr:hypothetical protein [Stenotrophomonas sp. JAI102]
MGWAAPMASQQNERLCSVRRYTAPIEEMRAPNAIGMAR